MLRRLLCTFVLITSSIVGIYLCSSNSTPPSTRKNLAAHSTTQTFLIKHHLPESFTSLKKQPLSPKSPKPTNPPFSAERAHLDQLDLADIRVEAQQKAFLTAAVAAQKAAIERANQSALQSVRSATIAATAAPAPSPVSTPYLTGPGSSTGQASGLPTTGTWGCIIRHESGGNPSAVSPNGLYFGLFQFDIGTWESVGGSGSPADASVAEQWALAQRLYSERGWQPWSGDGCV